MKDPYHYPPAFTIEQLRYLDAMYPNDMFHGDNEISRAEARGKRMVVNNLLHENGFIQESHVRFKSN